MTVALESRSTPSLNGLDVVRATLRDGLTIRNPLITGLEGNDIVRSSFAGRQTFVLRHPDYVDHVLHEACDRYRKSVEYELLRSVVGLSLFTDESESWRRRRRLLSPLFAKRHLVGMCDLMIDPIEAFVERLDDGSDRIALSMTRGMTELTLDVVGSALFGRGMADLARQIGPDVTLGLRAAERATRAIMVVNPPWWLFRACASFVHHAPLLPRSIGRVQAVMRNIDETVWRVVRERQRNSVQTDDLLGLLLSVRTEDGRKLPLKRVRDEATTFILAGHETTANALSWMWYLLALNADARERMLKE